MEVSGIIKLIKPTQEVNASFKKRELVVTTDEQYPQDILMECNQGKCDDLNQFKEGDKVTVSINLRGREWTNPQGETKYFNTIQAWRIALQGNGANTSQMPEPAPFEPNNGDFDPPF